jgi:hypothetical protein
MPYTHVRLSAHGEAKRLHQALDGLLIGKPASS